MGMSMKMFTGHQDKKGWGGQGKGRMYHYIPSVLPTNTSYPNKTST